MNQERDYLQRWLDKAQSDLKVAEHEAAVNKEERVNEAICFHCQQAAEKYLKAYLVFREIEFGKTHNLEYLLELCAKEDADFSSLDAGNLSFFAVEVRYPDDFYLPTEEEVQKSLSIAKAIKDFVLARID